MTWWYDNNERQAVHGKSSFRLPTSLCVLILKEHEYYENYRLSLKSPRIRHVTKQPLWPGRGLSDSEGIALLLRQQTRYALTLS